MNAEPAGAPAAATAGTQGDLFQPPRLLSSLASVNFPPSAPGKRREGWVTVEMMVDTKGKPYEATALDSSGNTGFEQAALEAMVKQISFRPASLGTALVDSVYLTTVYFRQPENARGASGKFGSAYAKLTKAIDAGDKARADEALADLTPESLYEDAFRSRGRYLYDLKWGTDTQQLEDLWHAAASGDASSGQPAAQLTLCAKLNDDQCALDAWDTLQRTSPGSLRPDLQQTIDRIRALQKSDQIVRMSGEIGKRGSWNRRPFRNRFDITVASGSVSEIKLRCSTQFVSFKYQPGMQYSVDAKPGECYLEVLGAPGTKFELTQH